MAPSNPAISLLTSLQPGSGEPLHRQVERSIRELIALPDIREGALLPDESSIANRLGVSRGTARAALARLVSEGVLERRAGVGTRVARPRAESGIQAWHSFSREMAAKGIDVMNFSSTFREYPATKDAARALQVKTGAPVQRLDRVRGWNGRPVLLSQSWLHPRLRLNGKEDFEQPLYEMLEQKTGVVAENVSEEFAAIIANASAAARLDVKPGTPLLLRRHTVSDIRGRPIEYAEVKYVSSRFTLTLEMRREQP